MAKKVRTVRTKAKTGQMVKSKRYPGVYTRKNTDGTTTIFTVIKRRGYNDNKPLWEKAGKVEEGFTLAAANKMRMKRISEIRRGVHQKQSEIPTLNTAFKKYLEWAYNNDKKDPEGVKCLYNKHVAPHIGQKPLNLITSPEIEGLKGKWTQEVKGEVVPLSNTTRNNIISIIGRTYRRARKLELYFGHNPVDNVEKYSRKDGSRFRFLTPKDAQSLLLYLKDRDFVAYAQCNIALFCGLRKSEVMKLKGEDIYKDDKIIRVRDVKDSNKQRDRYIPYPVALDEIFKELKVEDGRKVFNNAGIQRYSIDAAIQALQLNDNREKGDRCTFHTLRHTYATWLAKQGIPLQTIQKYMGHSSIQMTEIYAHFMPRNDNQEAEGLVRMLNGHT